MPQKGLSAFTVDLMEVNADSPVVKVGLAFQTTAQRIKAIRSCMKRVLVTGASGFLGTYIAQAFARRGLHVIAHIHQSPCQAVVGATLRKDLLQSGSGIDLVVEAAPDLVVHCAALTDVDACEDRPEQAMRLNAALCGELGEGCKSSGARLVAFSTDQLWANATGPIAETEPVDPPNVYGASKAAGEAALEPFQDALVLRTNFFGNPQGKRRNYISYIRSACETGQTVTGFADIHYTPIFIGHLVALAERAIDSGLSGIFNLAGADRISKYNFTRMIVARLNADPNSVLRGSSEDANMKAFRPKEMSLDCRRIEAALGCSMPTTKDGLDAYFHSGAQRSQAGIVSRQN